MPLGGKRAREQPNSGHPGPLGDQQRGVLREAISGHGRLVRLSLDCGAYEGAQPYFTVAYFQRDRRRPQVARYTPFRARAEWIFERLCQDLTAPRELAGQ